MIQWRDVPGYEGLYQVSDSGLVLSLPKSTSPGKILRPSRNKDGYLTVCLSKENRKSTLRVSRLVALAFIPNPEYKLEVNHIDGNKENITWCDPSMLTHTPPDTLERLRDDMYRTAEEWREADSVSISDMNHWADRLTALIERKGGAE